MALTKEQWVAKNRLYFEEALLYRKGIDSISWYVFEEHFPQFKIETLQYVYYNGWEYSCDTRRLRAFIELVLLQEPHSKTLEDYL